MNSAPMWCRNILECMQLQQPAQQQPAQQQLFFLLMLVSIRGQPLGTCHLVPISLLAPDVHWMHVLHFSPLRQMLLMYMQLASQMQSAQFMQMCLAVLVAICYVSKLLRLLALLDV